MMELPPGELAGRRSGIARENAPTVAICDIAQVSERIPTAAGASQFIMVPGGNIARVGRSVPAFSSSERSRVEST